MGVSNSDSGGGDGNSDCWGGSVGSEGDSDGSGDDSNNGNNGGSCNSDGDDDGDDAGNDEEDGHDDDDMTAAAVRAAGATKTTTVTAMAGGTHNNQLKAQLHPAHDGNDDHKPEMFLAVVVVAAMTVWEGGSAVDPLVSGYGQTVSYQPHIHTNTIRSSCEQHCCPHNLWCILLPPILLFFIH